MVALVVTIGVSFAIDALVTEAMVYAHVWTAPRGLLVSVALVVVLVASNTPARTRMTTRRGDSTIHRATFERRAC